MLNKHLPIILWQILKIYTYMHRNANIYCIWNFVIDMGKVWEILVNGILTEGVEFDQENLNMISEENNNW